MKTAEPMKARPLIMGPRYWLPALVLILGLLGTGLLFQVYRMGDGQRLNCQHIDALMDIQVRTAVFRLGSEVALAHAQSAMPLSDLDEALQLSNALVYGGESEHGTPMGPLKDLRFRENVQEIGNRLKELKQIGHRLLEDTKGADSGSTLNQALDRVFLEIMQSARSLEILAEESYDGNIIKAKRILFIIVALWALVITAFSIGLYRLERRRRWAELALETANQEMEQRVRDRTFELAAVNSRLLEQFDERQRAEDSLRQSEEGFKRLSVQFRTLLDTIPDRITLVSRDLQVLWANRGAHAASPFEGGHFTCEYCYTLWHGRSMPCDECPVLKSFATCEPASARAAGTDGRQWDIRSMPIVNEEGTTESVLEVATDITEKVSLQTETMRAAHLASLGELSAGVAHEINNPVNGIINCAQILCDKRPEGSKEYDLAMRILKEGDRIGNIVRGLLAFARESKEEKRPVAVKEILSDVLALTHSQINKEGIDLISALPADLPEIVASPQQIQQVFMNIISNSRYALNKKYPGAHANKVLEIFAERVTISGAPQVRIVFEDRGTGIAPDLMHKVMEPFFTTKPDGKGTGLGLSISHGIISGHGGRFAVESVEGEFTRVVIDLPAKENSNGANSGHR